MAEATKKGSQRFKLGLRKKSKKKNSVEAAEPISPTGSAAAGSVAIGSAAVGSASVGTTSARRLSFVDKSYRSKRNSIIEVVQIDLTSLESFEDWLQADPRYGPECFQLKKYVDSGKKKLTLEGQAKSEQDFKIIPKLLKNDLELTWLSLGDSKIGPDGIRGIMDALTYNTSLKYICLSFNNVDTAVCSAMKEMLSFNRILSTIDLKNNNVGDDGFILIMEALENNSSITSLDLRRNNITGDSCHAMRDMLKTNATLQKIELRGNSIGDDGCRMITEALYNNTTLASLTLERNHIDGDVLKRCTTFLDRNKVIERHNKSIDCLGISYYVTIKDVDASKPYLAWAVDEAEEKQRFNTAVDEAAKTAQAEALLVFIETLRKIIDAKDVVPSTSSDEEFNTPIIRLMRDKLQLRRLLNQKIDDKTYLLHVLAKSEHPLTLDMLKFLVDRCGASFYTVLDDDGCCARAIALASEDKAKRDWATTHGSFLGRYTIEGGKGIFSNPVHKSATSIVHFACDLTKPEYDPKHQVAIKIMNDEETFTREQQVRLKDDQILSTLSSGDDIAESHNRYDTDSVVALYRFHSETDVKGQHYRCLVFEKMGKNLDSIITSELIAGKDERLVSWYGREIAKAVRHVHSKGYIHADIKPRNVIRAVDKVLKLIDLDSSFPTGEKLTKECSSAFVSPEIARALFGSTEEDIESIQEQIIEHQSIMAQLDLSINDDTETYYKLNGEIQTLLATKSAREKAKSTLLADESVDIWGFGIIMYYLCIGKPLFLYDINDDLANESEKNRLLTWQGLNRATLDELAPNGMSEQFRDNANNFLVKCLHADPKERFQSMEDIICHDLFLIL